MGLNSRTKTSILDFASPFFHAESKTDYSFSRLNFPVSQVVPFDLQPHLASKKLVEGVILRKNHRVGGFF